ncbi:MAG: L-threonylcarbamoyladenylate synthase [Thermodesulfobacteriota bacterium]
MKIKILQQAAAIIRGGGIVALPTETYYGLAVDPFNEAALARLFALKQRPAAKPLLTLIPKLSDLDRLVTHVPAPLQPLLALWPAPLTLVCPALPSLSTLLTGGTGTVGVRLSPHPVVGQFLDLLGQPVTATSANISGQPPACTAAQVAEQFGDKLDLIVDGGATPGGLGSTVVGCRADEIIIIRAGVLPASALSGS